MKDAWLGLEPRQRWVLGIAGMLLLATILYVAAWEPLAEARDTARQRVAAQYQLLEWLQAVEPVAAQLRNRREAAPVAGNASLLARVDETARAAGLAGAIQRIEPAGDGRVRIWLDQAGFEKLMAWLGSAAAEQGLVVNQLTAERADAEGTVNTRITLAENGL